MESDATPRRDVASSSVRVHFNTGGAEDDSKDREKMGLKDTRTTAKDTKAKDTKANNLTGVKDSEISLKSTRKVSTTLFSKLGLSKQKIHIRNRHTVWNALRLFLPNLVHCLVFVGIRLLLRFAFDYTGTIPATMLTPFIAGVYFTLSQLLKGVSDEYSEAAKIPSVISANVRRYYACFQLTSSDRKVLARVRTTLRNFSIGLLKGIVEDDGGVGRLDTIYSQLDTLHHEHIALWKETGANMSQLNKILFDVRNSVARIDLLARTPYNPIGSYFTRLLGSLSIVCLIPVESTGMAMETTLLPCILFLIFSFQSIILDTDDPFDKDGCVSVDVTEICFLAQDTAATTEEDFDRKMMGIEKRPNTVSGGVSEVVIDQAVEAEHL